MQRRINLDGVWLDYKLYRRNTNKIIISVKLDGEIHVTAGKKAKIGDIEKFIYEKRDFILSAREKRLNSRANRNLNCRLKKGDMYVLWGKEYEIDLKKSKLNEVREEGKFLTFYCEDVENEELKKLLIGKFEDNQRKIVFENLSEMVYNSLRGEIKEKPIIKIRKMQSCLGVCHYKNNYITMNKNLIHYPMNVSLYVMYHEYIHFIYPNHGSEFYKMLEIYVPDYKKLDEIIYN